MILKVFNQLAYHPLLLDLTIEEGSRLKVIYGSSYSFHAVDLDTSNQIDIYLLSQLNDSIEPHAIIVLSKTNGIQLLLCYNTYISNGKVMGWGNKAIEIRNFHSATLDGVFMHKRV
ncbi:unnamed protein product [Rotaria sp. Silwood2]|nr:unnamed protein product [Rotaria sp. Silwood2]